MTEGATTENTTKTITTTTTRTAQCTTAPCTTAPCTTAPCTTAQCATELSSALTSTGRTAHTVTATASSRRRWMRGTCLLAGQVAAASFVSGCGIFSSRAKPPPYPALTQQQSRARPRWRTRVAGRGGFGFVPAILDSSIWVAGSSGGIAEVDRESGRRLRNVAEKLRIGTGVAADAAMLVVISRDGQLVSLDHDGRQRWSVPIGGESVTPPLLTPEMIVVRTVDSRLIGFDRDDGESRWVFQRQTPALVLRQNAPMLYRDSMIIAGLAAGRVASIDPITGLARWETVIATPRGSTELERLIDIVGAPRASRAAVCVVAYQGRTACLQREDGRNVWARDFGSASGLGADRDIIVTVDNNDVIQALRASSGETVWKQDGYVRRNVTAPAVAGEAVLFGDRAGRVHRLAAADGQAQARYDLDSPIFTAPQVVDDVTYVLSRDGVLAAFDAGFGTG